MRSASWDLTFTDIDRTVSGGVSIRLLAPKQPHSMSAFRAISGAERTSDQMVATSLFDRRIQPISATPSNLTR